MQKFVRSIRLAVVSLLLCGSPRLYAQSAPKLDLALTYVAQRSLKANSGENFWSQGGSLELGVEAWHGFGVAAAAAGTHADSIGSNGVPLSLVTTMFGPRYRWHGGHRVSLYGEGLLGEAEGFRSLFPSRSGADESASSMAVQIGGGLDIAMSRHLALRALQAAWLRTQLPNSTNDRQNSLRLGAGVSLRFGR